MNKRIVASLITLIAILALLVGITISWSRMRYEFDYWQVSHFIDALWEERADPHPLKSELPMLSQEVVRIQFRSPAKKTAYEVGDGLVVEIPDDLIRTGGKVLEFSNTKFKVAITPSEINNLGPDGLRNVSKSSAREHLMAYFKRTTRHQLAKDVFESSLQSVNSAETLDERYRNLYLYSMKTVLLPYTAKNYATEFRTAQAKGFIFGRFPENDVVLVEACPADDGPFVMFYLKNQADSTGSAVEGFLSTLVIRERGSNKKMRQRLPESSRP